MKAVFAFVVLVLCGPAAVGETRLAGDLVQGGLIVGQTMPGSVVTLDGRRLRIAADGTFLFGFHRDAPPRLELMVTAPDGAVERHPLVVEQRRYDVQSIDGLPPATVTPPVDVLERIRREAAAIRKIRGRDSDETLFRSGFARPVSGPITGVYGSQRILNGKPRRPHYGIDFAAPAGTPVLAPAAGLVTLAEPDLYFSGGTVILDHGHGLSSAFLHLAKVTVSVGDRLSQGMPLGTVGATGRATGPHLDWRVNWFDRRLDPAYLVPGLR